jgi:hypothetical protein
VMGRQFGWRRVWWWVWRILLVASAAAVVVLSALKLNNDFAQGGQSPLRGSRITNIGLSTFLNPIVYPVSGVPGTANIGLDLLGLETANSAIRTRLAVSLDQQLMGELALMTDSGVRPLNASDAGQWMSLPVTLDLVPCILQACTYQTSVQIPLGDLLSETSTYLTTIDLFVYAIPAAYPQDTYVIPLTPQLVFPSNIIIPGNSVFSQSGSVTTATTITDGGGIIGKDAVIASNNGGTQILISRPGLDQSLTFAMAAIPALLGFLVFCLFLGARKRAVGGDSGIAVIIGLLAAWLTILPLRAVLVPQELTLAPQTRVDDLLIFDAAVVFLFITLASALIRRSPASDAVETEVDAQSTASVKIPLDAAPFISHAVTSLDDSFPENRRSAIATLAAARTPDANIVLREALEHPIPDVRFAAAEALHEIRDPDAVLALIKALSDPDNNVRSAAARALGEMKTRHAVPQLKKLRRDPDKKVRSAARQALRTIGK